MYKSYKRKYLDMIQQVVMKKDAKLHSMVKDNLELPSLMSLEDSSFKEELFQKMGETKMSKNDLIMQINKHKFIKFVSNFTFFCLLYHFNNPNLRVGEEPARR